MSKPGPVHVSSQAFSAMAKQAVDYSRTCAHGVVLGTVNGGAVRVSDVVPICHEPPTRTLVDTALSLVDAWIDGASNVQIIGWFTSPELLANAKPGPVELRIVASLASDDLEPVLLVLNNEALASMLGDKKGSANGVIQAFGKDFGGQWMEPLEVKVEDESKTVQETTTACQQGEFDADLTDHWKAPENLIWKALESRSV